MCLQGNMSCFSRCIYVTPGQDELKQKITTFCQINFTRHALTFLIKGKACDLFDNFSQLSWCYSGLWAFCMEYISRPVSTLYSDIASLMESIKYVLQKIHTPLLCFILLQLYHSLWWIHIIYLPIFFMLFLQQLQCGATITWSIFSKIITKDTP